MLLLLLIETPAKQKEKKSPSLGHTFSGTECFKFSGRNISNPPYRNSKTRLTPADINKSTGKTLVIFTKW